MERKPRAAEGAGRLVRAGKGNPFRRVPFPDASFKPLRFRPAPAERLAQPDHGGELAAARLGLFLPGGQELAARALRLMRFPARASRVSVKAFRTLPT